MTIFGLVAYGSTIMMGTLAAISVRQRHSARRWLPFTDWRAVVFAALCLIGMLPVLLFDGALLFGIRPPATTIGTLGIASPTMLVCAFVLCAVLETAHRWAAHRRGKITRSVMPGVMQAQFARPASTRRVIRLGADGEIEDGNLPAHPTDRQDH